MEPSNILIVLGIFGIIVISTIAYLKGRSDVNGGVSKASLKDLKDRINRFQSVTSDANKVKTISKGNQECILNSQSLSSVLECSHNVQQDLPQSGQNHRLNQN